jgi:ABC-type branched-subunit amino acid transport system substrate-binding protein
LHMIYEKLAQINDCLQRLSKAIIEKLKTSNKKLRYIALIAFIFLISLIFIVFYYKTNAIKTYTLVGLFPLTGAHYNYGEICSKAAALAQKDVNSWLEENDKQWRLVIEVVDTQSDDSIAADLLKQYNKKGVSFYIGPLLNGATNEILDYANANELILASPYLSDSTFNDQDDWLFRYNAGAVAEEDAMLAAAREVGVDYIILGGCSSPSSELSRKRLGERALQAGLTILDEVIIYDSNLVDYPAEAARLNQYLEDLILQGGHIKKVGFFFFDPNGLNLLATALSYDYLSKIKWFGTVTAMPIWQIRSNPTAQKFASKTKMIRLVEEPGGLGTNSKNSQVKEFYSNSQKPNFDLGILPYSTYDLVWSLALAIDEAGYEPEAVKSLLPNVTDQWTKDYGSSGHLVFNQYGDRTTGNFALYYINDQSNWVNFGYYSNKEGSIKWDESHRASLAPPMVEVPRDYPTIQEAIDVAMDGSEIIVAPGTYFENVDFMGKKITLRSTNPDNPEIVSATIINGGGQGPAVSFQNKEDRSALLHGFTITAGAGNPIYYEIQSYDEEMIEFNRNYGGGILISGNSSPTISNNIIENNRADNSGSGTLGVGGGIAVLDNSSPRIENNMIRNNSAGSYGGGIAVWYQSSPVIKNNHISNNRAGMTGGGILVSMMCAPEITDNQISNNSAPSAGGLYIAHMSPAVLTDNQIEGNKADNGGGILARELKGVTITDNVFKDNKAFKSGGALYLDERAWLKINDNIFSGNTAPQGGGAIYSAGYPSAGLGRNSYSGNLPDNLLCPVADLEEVHIGEGIVFKDPFFENLGLTSEALEKKYGPTKNYYNEALGSAEEYYYSDLRITFAFGGYADEVNNIFMYSGSQQLMGFKVGMTFGEIKDILGEPWSEGYDEYLSQHGKGPYYLYYGLDQFGRILEIDRTDRLSIVIAPIELYLFARDEGLITNEAAILWKAYWWR